MKERGTKLWNHLPRRRRKKQDGRVSW